MSRVPEQGTPLELVARKRVLTATATIETEHEVALAAATEGVDLCRQLDAKDRRDWLGRALGTQGRVLLHTARAAEGESLLREALKHHEADDDAWARSAIYLAQCLRQQGRALESLEVTASVLRRVQDDQRSEQSLSTRLYAWLEQGRALLQLDRHQEAIEVLAKVTDGQPLAAYPALGARRSLVAAHLGAGDVDAARRYLGECVDVAMAPIDNETFRKVGAIAAAEEILRSIEADPLLPRAQLEEAWGRCFTGAASAEVVARWIY